MTTITVHPYRQRNEFFIVLTVTVVLLVTAAVLIAVQKARSDAPQRLRHYQISGIADLEGANQSMFTDLYTAALDIEYYHQSNGETWPSIDILEEEFIPPFVQDALWESRGRLQWKELSGGSGDESVHLKTYVGRSSNTSVAGSFLVLFEHFHSADGTYYLVAGRERPYSIWFRAESFDLPGTISEGTLIQNGWQEVVSYTGKQQRKSLNR